MKKVTDIEWEQLLKQSPSNKELCHIIKHTTKKDEEWAQLLKQNPSNDELCYIRRSIMDIIKER